MSNQNSPRLTEVEIALLDAIKSIWFRVRDDNALMRKTIETQLSATRWPDFATV